MRRLGVLTLAFAALAIAEIAVLVVVAGQIGVGWTVLAMLATSLAGAWLLRREGARAWRRLREAAVAGRPPGGEATRGLVGMASAVLLLLPGFLTDVVGLLLLVPGVRAVGARLVQGFAERRLPSAAAGDLFGPRRVRVSRPAQAGWDTRAPSSPVVEGEVVD